MREWREAESWQGRDGGDESMATQTHCTDDGDDGNNETIRQTKR